MVTEQTSRALAAVAPHRSGPRIAVTLGALLGLVALVLIFVPWQQTVVGYGQVSVYSAMDRPQTIEALIPGRLIEWRIQEGQSVRAGDVIARLEDIDAKFLDPDQPRRLERQRAALAEQRARAEQRATRLGGQIASLEQAREAATRAARQRVAQARQRRIAAEQALIASRKGFQIAREVAAATAAERVRQAQDRVRQAEQAVIAARQAMETARLHRERVQELLAAGLRSRRDDELAANELVKSQTEVRRAELALEVSRRDASVGGLDQNRIDLEIERAQTEVERARAALEIADRDIVTATLDLNRVIADTTAALSSVGATLESAREGSAKVDADLEKLEVERQNVRRRVGQQVIRAPRSGRVVRLLQVGAGAAVKAGDVLAELAPETSDRAVELMISDNDIPLLAEGRKVRLQFAGWPALQFSGFPSVSTGTFGGVVSVIDAVDDGSSRYRVIVRPDDEAIRAGRDAPWPRPEALRPGAEATGWVLLGTVPLGLELWRQFNAFPPTVARPSGSQKESTGVKTAQEKKSPYLKIKTTK